MYEFVDVNALEKFIELYTEKYNSKPRVTAKIKDNIIIYTLKAGV